jgi:1,4-dihydroxy-2-naphthoate octaprenyltransferase
MEPSTIAHMSATISNRSSTPPTLSTWLLAIRPKTLPAAVAPVLVGCAVAWHEGGFAALPALAAFAVALLLQIGANLANDVADFHRGADTAERLGPARVTQTGLLTERQVVLATALVLAIAVVPGLYLVSRGGPVLAAVGMLAILAAVAYTAGPKPFGYLGLGEVFVFLFFGPVAVAGTVYVQTGIVSPLALISSLPMGCLVAAILVVNNLRDIETDRAAGKRTLAVRIGVGATRGEYLGLLALAYATPLLLWLSGTTAPWVMLAWATAPLALALLRRVQTVSGRGLNPVLAGTARLCLWFAVAFGAGLIL